MARALCPGSAKPPAGNDTGFTGRCSVCRLEFMLSGNGNIKSHKAAVQPAEATDHVFGSSRFEVQFDRSGDR
jgi:hypothetical protein